MDNNKEYFLIIRVVQLTIFILFIVNLKILFLLLIIKDKLLSIVQFNNRSSYQINNKILKI